MLTLTFRNDGHVTKNFYRFEEWDEEANRPKEKNEAATAGKLYLQRTFFTVAPDEITVKVEW